MASEDRAEESTEVEAKKRKRRPKFDENSLVRPSGLTSLKQSMAARTKVIARGREAQYVRQLMREYQAWGYGMVPWLAFEDMVIRCQKLRGKKAVQEIIQSMRDDEAEVYVQRKYGELSYKRRRSEQGGGEFNSGYSNNDEQIPNEESDDDAHENIDGVDAAVKAEVSDEMRAKIARKREEAIKKKHAGDVARQALLNIKVIGDDAFNDSAVNAELAEDEYFEDEDEFFDDGPTEAEVEYIMDMERAT